ncbi:RimJ/RimL family protein N-acetyltransferase [Kitasatospora sp. MAP12-15]|uniref:GNAT family N-acetyltransferase n=1 Tax=unclassified Kitasatospora TaxID=2633591 RepID=UPI0024748378|nr:GNAT family N-acetyltransferase [Kitasatospora sp. MAP12-44]MDH6111625.1 RimJ/RimL family protein N-acetyltransferase [Kitasatospora sp. MAP12-44]
MTYIIRPVRAEEWPAAKEIRLAALADPIAHLAFLDTYEAAVIRPDTFWQERTAWAAEGRVVRQFVGQDAAGRWLGTVTARVEQPGDEALFGPEPKAPQTHVVGVFVRPEARGTGLAEALFQAAVEWSWELPQPRIERVRLFVHERNARAQAFYAKAGFQRTGLLVAIPDAPEQREVEFALARS